MEDSTRAIVTFIKLRADTLIFTLIIVIIKLSITKLVKILNFNYIGVLNIDIWGLKGLI